MPLADLLSAIESDASEELERLERESRAQAASIVERARVQAAALEAELIATAEPPAQLEAERIRAAARLEAAATLRATREAAFVATLDVIRDRLASLRESARYPALFGTILDESRAALPTATTLRVDPRDEELARPLAGELRIEASLDTWGGVELEAEGRIVRNTLEHRLASAMPSLRQRFAAMAHTQAEEAPVR